MAQFAINAKGNPITLAQYRALEDAGRLRRPLTDYPLGAATEGKRANDASYSALHTVHDSPVPDGPPSTWRGARPKIAGGDNSGAAKRARKARRIAAEAPQCPAEPRNGPTGTSTTPQTVSEDTA
jgi:hypothetical protein